MAVPCHDERDFEFATSSTFHQTGYQWQGRSDDTLPFVEYGILTDSQEFSCTVRGCKDAIVAKLEKEGRAEPVVNFRLRDWLTLCSVTGAHLFRSFIVKIVNCSGSRRRPSGQTSYDVEFTPDGESPLAKCDSYMNTTCPKCGKPAKRDPDTLDTFVCSSWYYLRYPDNRNEKEVFNREWVNKILPVDKYVGGAEHAAMHLLYARFFTKALRDMGYLDFDEPFLSLVHQGTILGPDGARMVNPG